MKQFFNQVLITALWSGTQYCENEQDDLPLDQLVSIDDFSDYALSVIKADCEAFLFNNSADLSNAGTLSQNAHDYWLTRNKHGAGFFDRDYDSDVMERLSVACDKMGECQLYIGDDNKVYIL